MEIITHLKNDIQFAEISSTELIIKKCESRTVYDGKHVLQQVRSDNCP